MGWKTARDASRTALRSREAASTTEEALGSESQWREHERLYAGPVQTVDGREATGEGRPGLHGHLGALAVLQESDAPGEQAPGRATAQAQSHHCCQFPNSNNTIRGEIIGGEKKLNFRSSLTFQEGMTVPTVNSAAKSESISRRKSLLRHRRIISETRAFESHILHGKQRFVTLITLHDPAGSGNISVEELESIIHKMRPPISRDSLDLILRSLPSAAGEERRIDYQPLIKGDMVKYVEEYLSSSDSYAEVRSDFSSSTGDVKPGKQTECDTAATGTMGRERGALSTAYKEEERRQFEILLEFCRERGIVLNKEITEKGTVMYI